MEVVMMARRNGYVVAIAGMKQVYRQIIFEEELYYHVVAIEMNSLI